VGYDDSDVIKNTLLAREMKMLKLESKQTGAYSFE
jgi:hypothetical protein